MVETVIGGSSYEGRDIKGVKVTFKEGNKGVFLEAGIHAREWISPAAVTYMLNEILTNQDPSVREIIENYNWYVFPVTNPDGYEYTHTHVSTDAPNAFKIHIAKQSGDCNIMLGRLLGKN